MTAAASARPERDDERSGRRPRPLTVTLVVVIGLIAVFFWFAGFYADVLWYEHLGYLQVLLTEWGAAAGMFVLGLLGMALPLVLNLQIAYRSRPVYAKLNDQLDRYQQIIEPLRKAFIIGIPLALGLLAGTITSGTWQTVLLWINATPFGETDPRFGLDVGFYVFQLPFWRGLVTFASAVTILSLLLTAATAYLYGGIRITGREVVISKSTRVHVAVLAAIYLALQAVSIWLDRYDLLTEYAARWTGAMFADSTARIPGLAILAGAAAIVSVLFVIAAAVGRWRLPLVGTALLVVVGLVVGSAYPWLVQQFQVGPSEQALERPYIQDNINATRAAYGLDDVEVVNYDASTTAEPGQLREDADTTSNIRILDPAVVQPTFAQFQQERTYFSFSDPLDVDRYTIDDSVQDTVSAVRELNLAGLDAGAQTWVNETIVYTHGYGLVAAYGNQRTSDGLPVFMQGGMPSEGSLEDFKPQVYFGENSPTYSIVGQPDDATPIEFDHVTGADGTGQAYTTYNEDGGPSLGNLFNRLVYSIKFQSEQVLLSDYVNENSQILYDRDPELRVQKAAPYLTIDSDPYATVVDGRIVWVVDAYTTTSKYPYSTLQSYDGLIADAPSQVVGGQAVNYIRNSVKATVDAYSGEVTLYAWDTEDPILQTWGKIFPNTLKPVSEMSGDLLSHVRYPSDLFKVQRTTLATYHVTDPDVFYNQFDAWELPLDPTQPASSGVQQPPYYLTLQMPEQDPAFSIYSTFIPRATEARNVLTGYLSANANAGSTAGQVAEDYGKLTLLRITNDNVNGPGQVQNIFNSNETVATQLNILERGGQTSVVRGNLLTLPVGGGFLYVQPVYVQSTGSTSYPLLTRVLVAFGDKIAFEDTLGQALDTLFGGDSGAVAGDEDVAVEDDGTTGEGTDDTSVPVSAAAALSAALADATEALQDRTAAYQANDLVAAAEADKRLQDALSAAAQADAQLQAELGTGSDTGSSDTGSSDTGAIDATPAPETEPTSTP